MIIGRGKMAAKPVTTQGGVCKYNMWRKQSWACDRADNDGRVR